MDGRGGGALARIARALTGLALAAACGCGSGEHAAPSAECREFGVLCKLESGPLGVCESRSCGAGETAPCFACTPQH